MVDWIAKLVEGGGYLGIAALLFAENLFPPIPSELIMTLAGFAAARGPLDIFLAVAARPAGSIPRAAFWHGVGRRPGSARRTRGDAPHAARKGLGWGRGAAIRVDGA